MSSLQKYNSKRNFTKTKEPMGKIGSKKESKLHFVVQHHLARKDHYDLRLEWNGVMKSWAVPKGPSYNPKDKRLAVQVEDHPLSYRHFEGNIPIGEYGAGPVMIWDEGYWEPIEKIPHSFNVSSFKFILKGKRLQGAWTLIHFKNNNWLLKKENDDIYLYNKIKLLDTSIKTKRTMQEIKDNKKVNNKTNIKEYILDGIKITNPNKVIFKNPKITKWDLACYYHKVAKRMLPYLENRLLSTVRLPDGLNGSKFFQKHFNPQDNGLKKIKLKKEDYYYLITKKALISEVQMNSFEFHIGLSKVYNLENPDLMVFDLDPDENLEIEKLREGVRDLKSILDKLHLKSYLKVSGGKGYHIVVPLKKKISVDNLALNSQNIAKLMEATWPDKYTSNIRKDKRKGKIFIDWLRNTKNATFVCPYSIRLREKCSISIPISWKQLDQIKPNDITITKALNLLNNKDPWDDFYK